MAAGWMNKVMSLVDDERVGATPAAADVESLRALRTASAVRERCRLVYHWLAEGRSKYFQLDERRLADVADMVAKVTRANYPGLDIPYHSRWRHFAAGGVDRWGYLSARLPVGDRIERARAAIDLVTVSVLLDAGAGPDWCYKETDTATRFARSEGLAVATLAMFQEGLFSSDPSHPYRVDAEGLLALDLASLARGFQVTPDNPLIGLEQRLTILRGLGEALFARAEACDGAPPRPGHLVDWSLRTSSGNALAAPALLAAVLDGWSSMWPSGLTVAGVALGDAGRHPAVRFDDPTDGIVPFHKLSQWLTYSLIEPLAGAGLVVGDIDGLTGLPEYRNGGLFVDFGVLQLKRADDASTVHAVTSEMIVEWRALTVVLLDLLRPLVAERLGLPAAEFPLAKLLQGGTWAAGREIARRNRPPHGASPIGLQADGSVF